MLPVFNIEISDVSPIGFNPHTGNNSPFGSSFLFAWKPVFNAAEQAGTNIDTFLTRRLAKFLKKKKIKTSLLIFFAPLDDYFVLTICSKKSADFFGVLHSSAGMPGYIEYGQEHIRANAKPFLYYAGLQIFRVYEVENPQPDNFYASDFGNQFGLTTSIVDEESHKDIMNNPTEYLDHCAVSTEPTTRFIDGGSEIVIQHAFIKIK